MITAVFLSLFMGPAHAADLPIPPPPLPDEEVTPPDWDTLLRARFRCPSWRSPGQMELALLPPPVPDDDTPDDAPPDTDMLAFNVEIGIICQTVVLYGDSWFFDAPAVNHGAGGFGGGGFSGAGGGGGGGGGGSGTTHPGGHPSPPTGPPGSPPQVNPLTPTVPQTPIPGALWLFGSALAIGGLLMRRKP